MKRISLSLLAATVIVTAAPMAHAQTVCSSLPNAIYLQIGDTQEPLIKALGKRLRDSNKMTIIYITSGSCTNINAFYTGGKITTNPKFIPSQTEVPNWTETTTSPTCTIDAAGHTIDVANSNVQVDSCSPPAKPATVGLFSGAIQGYGFAIPKASTQTAITAEEAYFTFGFGQAGQITPWNDPNFFFGRTATKSTLVSIAANIGVPPAKWKTPVANQFDQSTQVVNALVNAGANAEKSIGILGVEIYDANRSTLGLLAYRAYGQKYAYWPDSTPTATDKINVRDGHYTIWSPTVYMTTVDGNNAPTDANAAYLLDLILNKPTPDDPGFSALDVVISKGLVPQCAMKVSRTEEGGNLSLYSDPAPCGCYFESKVGTTACTQCTGTGPCGSGGTCRLGYCEAR